MAGTVAVFVAMFIDGGEVEVEAEVGAEEEAEVEDVCIHREHCWFVVFS